MGHYKSINAMAKDIILLTKNAKAYNEPGSQVYKVIYGYILLLYPSHQFLGPASNRIIRFWFTFLGFEVTLFFCLKDANTIKKVFIQRRTELEQAEPTKSSLRIRYLHHPFWFDSELGLTVPLKV